MNNSGDILVGIFLTLLVCVLAWLTTRFLSGRLVQSKGFSRTFRPTQMEIVERLNLGRERQILLFRVGAIHYLAGITANGFEFGPQVALAQTADSAAAAATAAGTVPAATSAAGTIPASAAPADGTSPADPAAARPPRFDVILDALLRSSGTRGRSR